MKILFCNIGWMEKYQGLRSSDEIIGGGAYVKEKRHGHEVCNFNPDKETLYGYVEIRGKQININRIGALNDADSVEGVIVVWTAPRPGGGTVIVGWYKGATVFRDYQEFGKSPAAQSRNKIYGYWISAPFSKATLLPMDSRVFEIPRRKKGFMGQSNIWYADSNESAKLVKQVRALIATGSKAVNRKKLKHGNAQDQARKARVEKAAISACVTYFESLGYDVKSVEKDNAGWDLVATLGRTLLRIEVKGLSGTEFSVELTPNEYSAFSKQANDYRLAVVLDALKSPLLSICRYSTERRTWVVDGSDHSALKIKVKQSASITCQ